MSKTKIAWIIMILSFTLFFYKAYFDIDMAQPMLTTMAFVAFMMSTLTAIFLGNSDSR